MMIVPEHFLVIVLDHPVRHSTKIPMKILVDKCQSFYLPMSIQYSQWFQVIQTFLYSLIMEMIVALVQVQYQNYEFQNTY